MALAKDQVCVWQALLISRGVLQCADRCCELSDGRQPAQDACCCCSRGDSTFVPGCVPCRWTPALTWA